MAKQVIPYDLGSTKERLGVWVIWPSFGEVCE